MAKLSAFLLLVAITACGPNNRNRRGGDDDSSGDGGNQGTVDAPACATSVVKAEKIPLDLYVMLDQSGSMSDSVSGGGTKWTTVTRALGTFVQQPGLDGVSVGIQYFGVPPGGGTCRCCRAPSTPTAARPRAGRACRRRASASASASAGDSCTAADYATPAVEIAPLPGVASAIVSSMAHALADDRHADLGRAAGRGRSREGLGAVAPGRRGRRRARDRRRSERVRHEPRRTSTRSRPRRWPARRRS